MQDRRGGDMKSFECNCLLGFQALFVVIRIYADKDLERTLAKLSAGKFGSLTCTGSLGVSSHLPFLFGSFLVLEDWEQIRVGKRGKR
ncbi:hypothetical protein OPV22_002419 [Ensete ventricosum]|uniref:Uncharacterized protein n=1 Tax=Ensete ventricosum TaxID=4639 RepID=A0AAV8RXX2_ENSVE|nr:hypothetical protein OPV22_002419 [Ensete ventricosum]